LHGAVSSLRSSSRPGYSEYRVSTQSTPVRQQVRSAAQFRPPSRPGGRTHRTHALHGACKHGSLMLATSVPGLGGRLQHLHRGPGSPLPHLHRDLAQPCHICTGTILAHRNTCAGTRCMAATSAPGLWVTLVVTRSTCDRNIAALLALFADEKHRRWQRRFPAGAPLTHARVATRLTTARHPRRDCMGLLPGQ
jgi:hypothetical protein